MSGSTYALDTEQSQSKISPWIMVVIGAGSVLSSLDLFVVNLAFSSIRDSMPGATNQGMSWVLTAYSIAFAAFLVPSGRLADIYGRKRVFKLGLLIFAVASAGCAIAPDLLSLILARGLKGLGASLMIPTSLGLLLAAYPKTRHKQMISIWAATGSVAAALGPTLGGALVDINWRLIFLINLPVALSALWLSKHLVETPKIKSAFPDVMGSALLISGIAFLVAGISYSPDWGLTSTTFWLTEGAAILCVALFVLRSLHVKTPALDLRVFRVATFTVATLGMACFYVGFAIMLLGGTLFLTQVWHWDPMVAGAAFGIGPGTAVAASLLGGKTGMAPRSLTMLAGLLFAIAGGWWYLLLSSEAQYLWAYLPGLVLTGAAAGIGQTGFITGGTSALDPSQYATGTGIINTARQIGAAVGVAMFIGVSGTALDFSQFRPAWLLMATFGLLATLTAIALPQQPSPRQTEP